DPFAKINNSENGPLDYRTSPSMSPFAKASSSSLPTPLKLAQPIIEEMSEIHRMRRMEREKIVAEDRGQNEIKNVNDIEENDGMEGENERENEDEYDNEEEEHDEYDNEVDEVTSQDYGYDYHDESSLHMEPQ